MNKGVMEIVVDPRNDDGVKILQHDSNWVVSQFEESAANLHAAQTRTYSRKAAVQTEGGGEGVTTPSWRYSLKVEMSTSSYCITSYNIVID